MSKHSTTTCGYNRCSGEGWPCPYLQNPDYQYVWSETPVITFNRKQLLKALLRGGLQIETKIDWDKRVYKFGWRSL